MVAMRVSVTMSLAVLVTCGGTRATTDTATDGGPIPRTGVCCPITDGAPCNCAGGGGWAASAKDCPNVATCDVWFDTVTDAHGCPALVQNATKCCLCGPPLEAGSDAAGAPPCNAASECRVFAANCGGCTCEALGVSDPNPACDAGTVSCLRDPCEGKSATCDASHRCAVQ